MAVHLTLGAWAGALYVVAGGQHAELTGQRVPGVARYTGRLGLEAGNEGSATAHATWRFTGPHVPIGEPEVRSRSFSVLDVGASIAVGRNLVLDAELQNALGIRYAEVRASGHVTPGTPRGDPLQPGRVLKV